MKVINQEFVEEMDVLAIREHPRNPRKGDDAAVRESIERNDFFGAIIVQRSTNYILAGNTRYRAMVSDGRTHVPGFYVDCDDETATRIMLADNRTSDLAFYDDQMLFTLLRELVDKEGLSGTGYDRSAFDILLQNIEQDEFVGGVRQGVEAVDRLDAYNELDIRSLVLPYPGEKYEEVSGWMVELREALGFDTNADLVESLVHDALAAHHKMLDDLESV